MTRGEGERYGTYRDSIPIVNSEKFLQSVDAEGSDLKLGLPCKGDYGDKTRMEIFFGGSVKRGSLERGSALKIGRRGGCRAMVYESEGRFVSSGGH